jgi:hypothetical protein
MNSFLYLRYRLIVLVNRLLKHEWQPTLQPKSEKEVISENEVNIDFPENVKNLSQSWVNSKWVKYSTNGGKLQYFENVLLSKDGVVFSGLKAYSGSYVFPNFHTKFNDLYLVHLYKHYDIMFFDSQNTYLSVYDHWSIRNYFHWLCDSIPKLLLIKNDIVRNSNFIVIIPENCPEYICESLNLLKITYTTFPENTIPKIEKLITIDYLSESGFIHPILIKNRHLFLDFVKEEDNTKRIYLRRKKGIIRSIANEQVFEELLLALDFIIVETERLSFKEQISMFANCSFLISTHGAGLTNMIFMPTNSRVIEIGHSDITKQPLCYWNLAKLLGFNYYFIPCTTNEKQFFSLNKITLNEIYKIITNEKNNTKNPS